MRAKIFTIFLILLFIMAANPAAAESPVEIISVFSDENSMDITLRSHDRIKNGLIVFSLMHDNGILETQTLELDMIPDTETTRVIKWGTHFKFKTYEASAGVYNNGELVGKAADSFTYGLEVLPRFQIVDLSASSSGINLLLKPRSVLQPGVADFNFQLIREGEVIYSETREDLPITQTTLISINWPVLLEDHTDYVGRVKAFSHAPDIITSFRDEFSSGQDVEIDETDVDVDDFGVSVTLMGKSQVPFDGIVEVELWQDDVPSKIFSEKPVILTLNRDDTVGIIWNDLDAGTYQVYIRAKTIDGKVLDRYETVLFIPERVNAVGTSVKPQTSGFTAIIGLLCIIFISAFIRKW